MALESNFSFGASGNPSQPKAQPQGPGAQPQNPMQLLNGFIGNMMVPQGHPQTPGFDLGGLLQQLHQVRDPQGFANTNYVPGVNNASNPFANGFFRNSAAQLTPQQLAASQGSTAMNQWMFPNTFGPNIPSSQTPQEGAAAASSAPIQLDPALAAKFGIQPPAPTLQNQVQPPPMAGSPMPTRKSAQPKPQAVGPMGSPSPNPFSFSF